MSEELKKSAELLRHDLSSIDFSDIDKLMKNFEKDPNISSDVEGFYDKHFRDVLKVYLQEQLLSIAKTADNESKLQFARGTWNGLNLIKEWCERHRNISLSRFGKDKEDKPKTGVSIESV